MGFLLRMFRKMKIIFGFPLTGPPGTGYDKSVSILQVNTGRNRPLPASSKWKGGMFDGCDSSAEMSESASEKAEPRQSIYRVSHALPGRKTELVPT